MSQENTQAGHLERLRQVGELPCHEAKKRRRGNCRCGPRRRLEAEVRRQGASFAQQARQRGWTLAEAAERVGLSQRTLRDWQGRNRQDDREIRLLGRPLHRATPARRNEVIAALAEAGGGLSVPHLQQHFQDVARAELADLRTRYRRLYRGVYGGEYSTVTSCSASSSATTSARNGLPLSALSTSGRPHAVNNACSAASVVTAVASAAACHHSA